MVARAVSAAINVEAVSCVETYHVSKKT